MIWTNEVIREFLVLHREEEYQAFSRRIIPNESDIYGVRMPALRKCAKQIASEDQEGYLAQALPKSHEEKLIFGLVLAKSIHDEMTLEKAIIVFLPYITNWSICDCFCMELKMVASYRDRIWGLLDTLSVSSEEYVVRFVIVMMMQYYLCPAYIERVLRYCQHAGSTEYYANMASAWCISVAMANHPERIMQLLQETDMDEKIFSMAVQKIRDSYRISMQDKDKVKEIYQDRMSYVDLHIHTCYSDGTMTPEEVLARARKNKVRTIAICDHNTIEGAVRAMDVASQYSVTCILATEINALYKGRDTHILAYGPLHKHLDFMDFLCDNRNKLDSISEILIQRMEKEYPQLSLQELKNFSYKPELGGWKGIHYLVAKGMGTSLHDVLHYYDQYACGYDIANFLSVGQVVCKIHEAGGIAILAHPSLVLLDDTMETMREEMEELLEMGLDGIECYHPKNSEQVTSMCRSICKERGLMITSGSDSHGGFSNTEIGQMRTRSYDINFHQNY